MVDDPASWQGRLEAQQRKGLFRAAKPRPEGWADFCSNDFLGLAQEPVSLNADLGAGGTGSRLISGMHAALEQLEAWAARFWQAERAVYFPSGFQANLAVVQALATRHDVLLMDERIHASFHDASRLTLAPTHFFRHNSLADLEVWLQKLYQTRRAGGEIYVVTEGVFSMAATKAPLLEMVTLCRRYEATLVLDEAHSVGLYGRQGRGWAEANGLAAEVPVRVFPLGKAAGTQGALVVGTYTLGRMLENFARPLIYSTAPAPILCAAVQNRLEAMAAADGRREALAGVERQVHAAFPEAMPGAVLPVYPRQEEQWPALIAAAEEARLWVKPIRYPTVPKGEECLRLTLHAGQTQAEIEGLLQWAQAYDLCPLRVSET